MTEVAQMNDSNSQGQHAKKLCQNICRISVSIGFRVLAENCQRKKEHLAAQERAAGSRSDVSFSMALGPRSDVFYDHVAFHVIFPWNVFSQYEIGLLILCIY